MTDRSNTIGVGVIGANPDSGWARLTHLPAIVGRPEFELVAVSSRRQSSAGGAATAFGARHAFTDPDALLSTPGLDLVIVSVRVPDHAELVRRALTAGKAVLCEWPLAVDLDEARDLAALAERQGVFTAVGLQNRFVPAVVHARDLVREGRIGTPLSAALSVPFGDLGPNRPADYAYTAARRSGANALTVFGGHGLDLLEFIGGRITEVSGFVRTRFPTTVVRETGEELRADAPDEVAIAGSFGERGVFVAHIRTGAPAARFSFELQGTAGTLVLDAASLPAHSGAAVRVTAGDSGDPEPLETPERYRRTTGVAGPGPALAVAEMHAALSHAFSHGGGDLPDFRDAVRLHSLLNAIERASSTGGRERPY